MRLAVLLLLCMASPALAEQPWPIDPATTDAQLRQDWLWDGPRMDIDPLDNDAIVQMHIDQFLNGDGDPSKFFARTADLDGDGLDEWMVTTVPGSGACGTGGCMMYLYARNAPDAEPILIFRQVQDGIMILADQTAGLWDIALWSPTAITPGWRVYKFNGITYSQTP